MCTFPLSLSVTVFNIMFYYLEPADHDQVLSDEDMITNIKENCKLVVELTGKNVSITE